MSIMLTSNAMEGLITTRGPYRILISGGKIDSFEIYDENLFETLEPIGDLKIQIPLNIELVEIPSPAIEKITGED